MIKRILTHLLIVAAFALVFASFAVAQSSVDPTFNAVPSGPLSAQNIYEEQAALPDGKVLVWGSNLIVDGVAKGSIARLNSDGSLDPSFSFCECGQIYFANAAPLPDGKVLVAGSWESKGKIIRLNSDGSLDTTFGFTVSPSLEQTSLKIAGVAADGTFYAIRHRSVPSYNEDSLIRFEGNGALDSSFTSVLIDGGRVLNSYLSALEPLPDGSLYLAVNTAVVSNYSTRVRKYLPTGALDPAWTPPNIPPSTITWTFVQGLAAGADGSLVITGSFTVVNGVQKKNVARLLAAGNVDLNFTAPDTFSGTGVKLLSDGKILLSATDGLAFPNKLRRLNADGSLDTSYTMDASVSDVSNKWSLDASERSVFRSVDSIVRLQQNGSLDTGFSTNVGVFGTVKTLVRQADGKVVLAGNFTGMNGAASSNFVRVNDDGTTDPTFNSGTGFDVLPSDLYLQPDGKIIAIGTFAQYNGSPVPRIIRIMPDGTLDSGFNVVLNSGVVSAVCFLNDGRLYIGGTFATVGGTSRPGLARLNSDGSLDSSFDALIGGTPTIYDLVVQADGRVLVAGSFSGIGGFNRSGLVRLDSTGTLDQSFDPANPSTQRMSVLPDGRMFTMSWRSGSGLTVFLRDANGNIDPSFTAPVFSLADSETPFLVPGADGSVIVGGNFTTVGPRSLSDLVRLAPNGSLDLLFLPGGVNIAVRKVVAGPTDKVLVAGEFDKIGGVAKPGVARLNIAPYRKTTPFDFSGDGRADFVVYRPSSSTWYRLNSGTYSFETTTFGVAGDIPTSSDYDGDGMTDLSIFRPSTGNWWYRSSRTGVDYAILLGTSTDRFAPSDFDGDGKTDFVVYRPSNSTWYRYGSNLGSQPAVRFGIAGDIPVVGDFDGDGRGDLAIFRPSAGDWWYAASSSGGAQRATHFGANGDIPVPADFDGDGKTDMAVFRPSTGVWYVLNSSDYSALIVPFGLGTDKLIPADYDGDGKADIAVFRPSTGIWYILQSSSGFLGLQWGVATDVPVANQFIVQSGTSRVPTESDDRARRPAQAKSRVH
ncbi:MAG: VCBS repeat-containing protein [Acidobacteria bacterium]|nr:VCBS repeat-containing protein [Acidobacteriota bacterium]